MMLLFNYHTPKNVVVNIYYEITVDSRYSDSPPRYAGHMVRYGSLAICLLHKTPPKMQPLAISYNILVSTGCPKIGF